MAQFSISIFIQIQFVKYFLWTVSLFINVISFSQQQKDSLYTKQDSLSAITVQSFNYHKGWLQSPVSVGILSVNQLKAVSNIALLPAFNTIAGVRMEERSPSSYRLSIRGSLLRSPFGVRNIKFYWNGLPITDGGGNTYLNLIDITQINSVEIAKGPAASMYGAGTSGVVLLQSRNDFRDSATNKFKAAVSVGSYGLFTENVSCQHQSKTFSSTLLQSYQKSNGYRQQSASAKNNITWNGAATFSRQQLQWILFYTRLFYETPGGITLAQMQQDPTLARQPTATLPGAVQQKAAIYNHTFFAGLQHTYNIDKNLSTQVGIVLHHTNFRNPFITNYEKRRENNIGIQAKLVYEKQWQNATLQWVIGFEVLRNHSLVDDYGNNNGEQDTLQYKDNFFASQSFAFTQIQLGLGRLNISAGVSANEQFYKYKRSTDIDQDFKTKSTHVVVMPRLAVSYSFSRSITLYTSVARGFSPPSLAEVSPSNITINTSLQPENGWDAEMGVKGSLVRDKLLFDINYYSFRLKDAIVNRSNANGSQYFVNAGNTRQDGIEVWLLYKFIRNSFGFFRNIDLAQSYCYQPYRFIDYTQGNNNYSGNSLTGVPQSMAVTTLFINIQKNFYINGMYTQVAAIPLTDANDAFANDCHLLQCKIGWKKTWSKSGIELYAGADNMLNELYSLGNDINALGKRYYNPAAPGNYFIGCILNW